MLLYILKIFMRYLYILLGGIYEKENEIYFGNIWIIIKYKGIAGETKK